MAIPALKPSLITVLTGKLHFFDRCALTPPVKAVYRALVLRVIAIDTGPINNEVIRWRYRPWAGSLRARLMSTRIDLGFGTIASRWPSVINQEGIATDRQSSIPPEVHHTRTEVPRLVAEL